MSRRVLFLILSVTLFAAASSTVFCQEGQVPAPALVDGDFWRFQVRSKAAHGVDTLGGIIPDGTYILRVSGRRLAAYRLVNNEEQTLERSLGLFSLIGRQPGKELQSTRLTASSRDLQFPLFVGKTWQYTYEVDIPKGTRHRHVTIRVLDRETIDTAAGNFQTFKIEKYIQWARAGGLWGTAVENVQAIYFYSPETKSIVKYRSEATDGATREVELIQFGASDKAGVR
jgi:hypothetical protein